MATNGGDKRVVFTLPKGHRPKVESHFEVESSEGTSLVIVMPDGRVLADPNVEWVNLEGISFKADE